MHRPLSLITAGGVAAAGALLVATALPAGAATAVLDAQMRRARVSFLPGVLAARPVHQLAHHPGDVHGHDNRNALHNRAARHRRPRFGHGDVGGRPSVPPATSALSRLPTTAPLTLLAGPRRSPAPTSQQRTGLAVDTIPVADATYTIPDEASAVAGAIAAVPTPVTTPATPALPLPHRRQHPTLTDNAAGGISSANHRSRHQ